MTQGHAKHLYFEVQNIAHLLHATLQLGDLTILVGPQATGKSLLLQTFKLFLDTRFIGQVFEEYGISFRRIQEFNEHYYGQGYDLALHLQSKIQLNKQALSIERLLRTLLSHRKEREKVFYIPAQRTLIFQNNWFRSFRDFDPGTPFVVRWFSENLRWQVYQRGLARKIPISDLFEGETEDEVEIFPEKRRFSIHTARRVEEDIFRGYALYTLRKGTQHILALVGKGSVIPFSGWSTGQREFAPLLMSTYLLFRTTGRLPYSWVVIEEPELGLHPRGVEVVLLLIAEMLRKGLRVILSTHAPQVLEWAWALRILQKVPQEAGVHAFLRMFTLPQETSAYQLAQSLREKQIRVYYFQPQDWGIVVRDISSLNVLSNYPEEAEWGELLAFSTRVDEIVTELSSQFNGELLQN